MGGGDEEWNRGGVFEMKTHYRKGYCQDALSINDQARTMNWREEEEEPKLTGGNFKFVGKKKRLMGE